MANIQRNFIRGRMNKALDERLLPNGEYVDALNVRLGSTEDTEIGSVENSKGNTLLTTIQFNGASLSNNARCIGALEDGANETIYWFIHDPSFTLGATSKLDLIVSYNTIKATTNYHVVSINDGGDLNTTLNFSPYHLITGLDLIDNLIFFTDNLNPPRFIDINKSYTDPNINYLDGISARELLVIKAPPSSAPTISTLTVVGQTDDFLQERIVSFAYRYKYENGEYSATSQFSKPAFTPDNFRFSYNSYLNDGMQNILNAAIITFNSGDSLVKKVELLFKESNDSQIKVIEELDKDDLGYQNNTNYTYTFDDQKIFTLLAESETLRLFDNVPLKAKAQTIMGNRLVYGNYFEGYDLKDKLNQKLKLEFQATLESLEIESTEIVTSTGPGNYSIGTQSIQIPGSIVYIDFSTSSGAAVELIAGASLSLDFRIVHYQFTGNTPAATTSEIDINFDYVLPQNFNNVYELGTSTDFLEKVGTNTNIQPVATACDGQTLTDEINCQLPQTLGTYTKTASGITGTGQSINVVATPNSDTIGLHIIAMQYVDTANTATEFYTISFSEATYKKIGNAESLHSNRGYEVGIVYMDEFLRSSTALVSPSNTVQIPCENSVDKNQIKVTIPQQQVAPSWATSYKFVLKPAQDTYETIYSNIYFKDPGSNATYFLLEGENAAKVESGDRFFVKADANGPVLKCVEATVLEKKTQAGNFITVKDANGQDINVPAGAYMKINPSNFSTETDDNAIINHGSKTATRNQGYNYPILAYPMNLEDPANPGQYLDYSVPAGSRIIMKIEQQRLGPGKGNGTCERRINRVDLELFANKSYDNMSDWFYNDNIGDVIAQNAITEVGGSATGITNTTQPYRERAGQPDLDSPSADILTTTSTNYYRFYRDTNNQQLYLLVTGTQRCAGVASRSKRRSSVTVDIEINRNDSLIVFETQPKDASPDIWYENHLSFEINSDGHHFGNVQNQSSTQPAIINTEFFDCYSFGNGVESYKILDSINGKSVDIGERVTSTNNFDFREIHRFADLTYSGVYNDESNVNKLNEFNLGLSNFKPLEDEFGPVQILHGRKTDILVLQEDKISYVFAGKNLLTDATGGGAVASVPEVLGTQIARIEEYGISNNPESFVVWGSNKYFTDAKRGAVINLVGMAAQDERLKLISEAGMRSWFRDLFIETFETQKLGGFDPYMNEYVLHSNIQLPLVDTTPIECDISKTLTVNPASPVTYNVELGEFLGIVTITYTIPFQSTDNVITEGSSNVVTELNSEDIVSESASSGTGYVITATYGGVQFTSGTVYNSGSFTFNKNAVLDTQVNISVTQDSTSAQTIDVMVSCPQPANITIFNVAVTSNADAGKFITNEYRWDDGTFTSPLHSNQVEFSSSNVNPIVSQFTQVAGQQGAGVIPGDGASVSIISRKQNFDTFVFNTASNKLKYIRTNTFYGNTSSDITNLLSISTNAIPIIVDSNPTQYRADFVMPTGGQYLYLIWDYRESTGQELCYSSVSLTDACTGCTFSPSPTPVSPVPVTPVYTWRRSSIGEVTSPPSCPDASVLLYSTAASLSEVFINSTLFYTDASLTNLYQGNDYYWGLRQPNQGYGLGQAIARFTNSGTISNLDTTGVCNPQPVPVTPVTPVAPPPTTCYLFNVTWDGNPIDDFSYTYNDCNGNVVGTQATSYGATVQVCAISFVSYGAGITVVNTGNTCP